MKSVRLTAIGKLEVVDGPKPLPGPDEVLVRIEAAGICGTDRHLFHGEFPSKPPVTLGHEFSGLIEAMGSDVIDMAVGDRVTGDPNIACGTCVHCRAGRINLCRNLVAIGISRDGGFADYVAIPRKQAFRLPASLPPLHGAFCEPLACCIHGIDVAAVPPGGSMAVIGGGVIGLLTVQLAKLAGARTIVLITREESKRRLAEKLGATLTIDGALPDVRARLYEAVPDGVDVVLECAGVAATVALAPSLVRPGGKVVIVGVLAKGETVAIEPFDLLFREVSLLTAFINPFTHARAADLIGSGAIEVESLISRTIPLSEAPEVIANPPRRGEIKVLVTPAG